jgi:hypothetical protein
MDGLGDVGKTQGSVEVAREMGLHGMDELAMSAKGCGSLRRSSRVSRSGQAIHDIGQEFEGAFIRVQWISDAPERLSPKALME